jgi:hypothetical protein
MKLKNGFQIEWQEENFGEFYQPDDIATILLRRNLFYSLKHL